MKKLNVIAVIVLLLGLSSCLSTVHPIFTEKDLVFDPNLLGTWNYQNKAEGKTSELNAYEGKDVIRPNQFAGKSIDAITKDDSISISIGGKVEITRATNADLNDHPALKKLLPKIYMVRYKNKGYTEALYFGFLVKLGNNLYMDYYPAETEAIRSHHDFYKSHYAKMHTALRIRFSGNNKFELNQLDATYLKNLIRDKKIRIRHETREDDSFVVTASTEELQQYLLKYGNVPEAYYDDNSSIYTKVQ